MRKSIILLVSLFVTTAAYARETKPEPDKKAWEIGLGGTVFQFNRVAISNFVTTEEGHYMDMQLRQAVFGGNIYVARELTNVFALDFQGSVGFTRNKQTDSWHKEMLYAAGLGLQWRLGHYFKSRYIDPYLRIGGNYMYKGFDIIYANSLNGMDWNMENNLNKDGADGRHLFTVAAGAGINMWLNDRFGIGIQGDYLIIPKPNVANSLQGTARLMWRFGGKSKKQAGSPAPAYPVEKVVEYRDVIVRDTVLVEKQVVVERESIHALVQGIYFDFDSADLKPEYEGVIAEIADIMTRDTSLRYLISGFTDIRGDASYNERLSYRRAETVMNALVARGVPVSMLKVYGDGSKISHAGYGEETSVREGDRKIVIELITNEEYWKIL